MVGPQTVGKTFNSPIHALYKPSPASRDSNTLGRCVFCVFFMSCVCVSRGFVMVLSGLEAEDGLFC